MFNVTDFEQPFYGLKKQGTTAAPKTVPLVVILWQSKEAGTVWTAARKERVKKMVFGATNSLADWFRESSQGRYKLVPHPSLPAASPVVGPVVTDKTNAWYKGEEGSNEGFPNRYHYSYGEAIRKVVATKGIDFFKSLNTNRDGVLSTDECLVLLVKYTEGNVAGFRRNITAQEQPDYKLLEIGGLTFTEIAEWYCPDGNDKVNLAVAVEEVLHLAAGLADQYPDGCYREEKDPRRPGNLELTDAGGKPVHTDPYHKLKWGWLNPKVCNASGTYTLRATATSGDALLLYAPFMGLNEFFVIENRTRAGYDANRETAMNDGLAIWHCVQDTSIGDRGRNGIFLKRAQPDLLRSNLQIPFTLFAGNSPKTSYELSDASSPQNLKFRYNDSGIKIKNISNSGAVMTFDVEIPRFLTPSQFILSPNGKYKLIYQPDGNLVLYKVAGNVALWSSKTNGQPAGRTEMQADGNLVIYKPNGDAIWDTGTVGGAYVGSYLRVQDDANVVIYKLDGTPAWSSETYLEARVPSELTAGQKLQSQPGRKMASNNRKYALTFTAEGNLELRITRNKRLLWQSGTHAPDGSCIMQPDGNFVIYNAAGVAVWAAGTYGECYTGGKLVLQDDANLVIYRSNNKAAWTTNTQRERGSMGMTQYPCS